MVDQIKLKPCPFCDGDADVERIGTSRVSCIVVCTECGCRLESNEIGYGDWWNERFQPSCDLCYWKRPACLIQQQAEKMGLTEFSCSKYKSLLEN